ncbi:MAG: peptide-methionine (S)-S-oxide reductase MsrA [Gammaproteobacteria bacterium]|nr:peptide-methionine (S)-S-oxide reductase MsrA [Gammaproteobacteria bacterium]MCZ6893010.1 peptide-methionine (S)-S-oxide reductase MsrA [Gammaproteobacteria bacterium]
MRKTVELPSTENALPGRDTPIAVPARHFILDTPLKPPFPENSERAYLGLGCFWGAEKCFWNLEGVHSTAVGYAGGLTPNPTYEEVCTGLTGHNEVVQIVFLTERVSYARLLDIFWEAHDPTQGMRQGNDAGTQYRSGIYFASDAQRRAAEDSLARYQQVLAAAGYGVITTEIIPAPVFYFAEDYHQQYLAKNPNGYCGLGGTGVSCAA